MQAERASRHGADPSLRDNDAVARDATSIRILIEPLGDHSLNLGDVAMRQVAAGRLRELWPHAEISLLTKDAAELPEDFSGVVPLPVSAQRAWSHEALPAALLSGLPAGMAGRIRTGERELRTRWPRGTTRVITAKRRLLRQPMGNVSDFLDAVLASDLIFVSGAGAINDHFVPRLSSAFDLLSLAIKRGIPTVMMGQGIGPLSEGAAAETALRVLPHIDLIGLREKRTGFPLLTELGVSPERIVTTGDDAVELAHELRRDELGSAFGLNVRRAGYVELATEDLTAIASAIKSFLSTHEVEIVAVPTSRHPTEGDLGLAVSLAQMAGAPLHDPRELTTPEEAVQQIATCRVLVTGSYHAAVFALAQGIPAVCLALNPYYEQKFLGLSDLFGEGGCLVVSRDSDGKFPHLADALRRAWETADQNRHELLAAASAQVETGRAAYARIRQIVGERR
jgi:polysaccharide pyruvyl transferase WcaK-like protein